MTELFTELLAELNSVPIFPKAGDWAECLPEEIWDKHFKGNFKELASGLEPDDHRWYETSISVISIYGKLLGIKHITRLFSESMSYEDCYESLSFFEMKEKTVISYVRA